MVDWISCKSKNTDYCQEHIPYDRAALIRMEVERLTVKYGKESFDCTDLMDMLGIGRDNARALMRSEGFPAISAGGRRVVPVLLFVIWQLQKTA
jgi:hypothetical protein